MATILALGRTMNTTVHFTQGDKQGGDLYRILALGEIIESTHENHI
jgi:hypothetical protein